MAPASQDDAPSPTMNGALADGVTGGLRAPARLQKRREFLAAASSGRKAATAGLVLQWRARGDDLPPRFGFTTTKKLGGAVVRNRARRRLREVARLIAHDPAVAPILVGADLVLIGRNDTATRDFAALMGDLRHALARLAGKPGRPEAGPAAPANPPGAA